MKKYISIFTVLAIVLVIDGCFTLDVNFSGAKVHPDAKTFSVIEFTNRADIVEPGLALDLTEALRDKVESQTPLKLTNGYGDLTFEGEIYRYSYESGSLTAQEVSAQNRFTIGVKIKFTNLLVPEDDFEKNFEQFENFDGTVTLQTAKDDKTDEMITNLIEEIFKEAFVNW